MALSGVWRWLEFGDLALSGAWRCLTDCETLDHVYTWMGHWTVFGALELDLVGVLHWGFSLLLGFTWALEFVWEFLGPYMCVWPQ